MGNGRLFPVDNDKRRARGGRHHTRTVMFIATLSLIQFNPTLYFYQCYSGCHHSGDEHSSSGHRRQGSITKCGNGRAGRLLIEGAHSYRFSANISTELQKRQEPLSKEIMDIDRKAQLRLCWRYQRLIRRGKLRCLCHSHRPRDGGVYLGHCQQS